MDQVTVNVRVLPHGEGLELPKYETAGAAGMDLRAALSDPDAKSSGPYRNVFGGRIHCRLSRKDLAELNRRLREIEQMLATVHKRHVPSRDDSFLSLTVALMPLRNREVQS